MKQIHLPLYYPSTVKKVGSILLITLFSSNVMAQLAPTYGGQDHQTFVKNSVDNSNKTGINTTAYAGNVSANHQLQANNFSSSVSQNTTLQTDLYGGSSELVVRAGDATAGNASASGTLSYASAFANAQAAVQNSTIHANNNSIQVTDDGSVTGNMFGGSSILEAYSGKAIAGNATASGTDSQATAYAYSHVILEKAVVQSNENTISVADNASVTGNIYAGKAKIYAQSNEAYAGDVDGEKTSNFAHAHAVVSDSFVNSDRNTISITDDASVNGNVCGGYSTISIVSGTSVAGDANFMQSSNATANVHANSRNNIISANENIITVTENAEVQGNIFGGYAELIAAAGNGTSGTANGNSADSHAFIHAWNSKLYANDNQITLDGSLDRGSIYGGYIQFELNSGQANRPDGKPGDTSIDQSGSVAQAINNSITIGDNGQILDVATSLYGGYLQANPTGMPVFYDTFSGNTLNFSAKPIAIDQLANFEHYNFTIRPELANTQTSLITAKDVILGTDASNSNGTSTTSKINVAGIHSGPILNIGDTFYLIKAENSMSGFGGDGTVVQAQQGISLLYDVQTEVDMSGSVIAKILGSNYSSITVNPKLEALPSGQLAGALLVNQGGDLIADDLVNSLKNEYNGFKFFMHGAANHSQYDSGSLKANNKLFTAGVSYKQDNLASAFFVETGFGDYDSSINPANSKVKSDGNNRYYGIGTLGRYQFDNGLYTDGSIRVGNIKNTFSSKDIVNLATGENASYSLKNRYISTHLGVGKIIPLKPDFELDVSAKYLWTHLKGKNTNVTGDPISFKSIDSKRLRVNGNLSHQYSKNLTLNAGLGYEHEFDARAKGTTYDIFDIKAPDMRGGTGIMSMGATYQSEAKPDFSVDIKAQTYMGKRKGASLGVTFNYQF